MTTVAEVMHLLKMEHYPKKLMKNGKDNTYIENISLSLKTHKIFYIKVVADSKQKRSRLEVKYGKLQKMILRHLKTMARLEKFQKVKLKLQNYQMAKYH